MSSQNDWRWIRPDVVRAIHEMQIAEHGGIAGVRSVELLEAALARPRNRAGFDEGADLVSIGALYAIGIARNHPFLDGNKRVAWVVMMTFFRINGLHVAFDAAEAVKMMFALASSELSDDEFIARVRGAAR